MRKHDIVYAKIKTQIRSALLFSPQRQCTLSTSYFRNFQAFRYFMWLYNNICPERFSVQIYPSLAATPCLTRPATYKIRPKSLKRPQIHAESQSFSTPSRTQYDFIMHQISNGIDICINKAVKLAAKSSLRGIVPLYVYCFRIKIYPEGLLRWNPTRSQDILILAWT